MTAPVRLYLDDVRLPPDDGGDPWTVCRTVEEAKAVLLAWPVEEASLDHDLGTCEVCWSDVGPMHCPHVPTGLELVAWMVAHGKWPKLKPLVHSANRLFGPEMAIPNRPSLARSLTRPHASMIAIAAVTFAAVLLYAILYGASAALAFAALGAIVGRLAAITYDSAAAILRTRHRSTDRHGRASPTGTEHERVP